MEKSTYESERSLGGKEQEMSAGVRDHGTRLPLDTSLMTNEPSFLAD